MRHSKFNIIARLQRWLGSDNGQVALNYAYSWGAAIVILGALFKLTDLPGADTMLYVGMGTEVVVFILSGFDQPVRTATAGKDTVEAGSNTLRLDKDWLTRLIDEVGISLKRVRKILNEKNGYGEK